MNQIMITWPVKIKPFPSASAVLSQGEAGLTHWICSTRTATPLADAMFQSYEAPPSTRPLVDIQGGSYLRPSSEPLLRIRLPPFDAVNRSPSPALEGIFELPILRDGSHPTCHSGNS